LRPYLPDPADAVQLWRDWRAKTRPLVLAPYVDLHSRWRLTARFLSPLALGLFCIIYGFFFALTAPYLIVPFTAPLLILGALSIWALPENNTVPITAMELCFSALLIGLILWPNYLALTLPGLPWITMVRLTTFPLAFFLLSSLSMSSEFRGKVSEAAKGAPMILGILAIFSANTFISLPFSHNIGDSVNKVILQQFNWTGVLLFSLYIFRTPGRVERYAALLLLLAIPTAAVALLEFQGQHVPWAGHVPNFLRVEDPTAQRALDGAVRSATGQYRAKASFSTALGLAEYISLMTPFAMNWAVSRHSFARRMVGLVMLPLIFVVVRTTDSRLGVLGYLVSILAYVLLWSVVRWRQRRGDLLSSMIVYSYPAAFLALLVASLFVHKIHVLMFGGGAQSASNLHRQAQFRMAVPSLLQNPIGHGAGQSGRAMGYGAGDFIAIDSYWISLALDYGALGLVSYVALFGVAIYAAVNTIVRHPRAEDREAALLIPLVACLSAFLMIRGVFAQPEIHPLIFAVLGMTIALAARIQGNGSPSVRVLADRKGVAPNSRAIDAKPSKEREPMSFAALVLSIVGAAVVFYVLCLLWKLKG
jgi:hypothetical protein